MLILNLIVFITVDLPSLFTVPLILNKSTSLKLTINASKTGIKNI